MTRGIYAKTVAPVLLAALTAFNAGPAAAQRGDRTVPANTVVRVELEDRLSSATARRGERFMARLDPDDRSGFPRGTQFEGVVTEASRASKEEPGVLDVEIRRAIFPDGRAVAISGELAGLGEDDVRRRSDGRLESKHTSKKKKFDTKWVGYGAAGGAVLSTIFGGGFLKGALLGALGGAIYGYVSKDKGRRDYHEVELASGTEFGIRLADRVAFNDDGRYRDAYYEETDRDRDLDREIDRDRDRDRDREIDRDRDRDRDFDPNR
jgi:hypothetical protein